MFDIKWIRENAEAFDAGMARRGLDPQAETLTDLDATRRDAQTRFQDAQAKRNAASKEIGRIKGQGGDASAAIAEVSKLKSVVQGAEEEERTAKAALDQLLAELPNLPFDDVPEGMAETDAVEVRKWGEPRSFNFEPKQHFEIGEAMAAMDFETAAAMSGSRFVLLSGQLAALERAIGAFMLDLHSTEYGYTEISPPVLVRDQALFGTGQLPKFAEDLFKTTNDYWLIPTAEVALTNIVREKILPGECLPLRFVALTPCFRSEAGAAGKDTRGMIRQHQFQKVELVSVTAPEDSAAEHERMTECAEEVLKRLKLPYRTVVLSAGDMGFSVHKTYDIEVWLPGQNMYREISSCSNCGDFQARRMAARYRSQAGEKGTRFVHTLNGSGVAVGRALIAVLENYQNANGTVTVPDALRSYMHGLEVIGADD